MSRLDIVEWPNKVLETKALEVTAFDGEFARFVEDMFETMEANNGLGLAANQVGVLKRVFIMCIPYDENDTDGPKPAPREPWHDSKLTFVNPQIIAKSGKAKIIEGCLSFPDVYEYVDRHKKITVKAQDASGREFQIEADGLLSICIQHEMDHIDGVVFVDRMSRLKAKMVKKKLMRRQLTEASIS